MKNVLTSCDVYKMSHCRFYPEGTTQIYSYLCARSSKKYDKAVFFGLQYYLQEYLSRPILRAHVEEFLELYKDILGAAPEDVQHKFHSLAELGYWPVKIKAVKEGTVVDNNNVLMTMTNTHKDFAWTVGFLETLLLKIWAPITVATHSKRYKTLVESYAQVSSDDDFLIPFLIHDFGARGVSSEESAAICGAAHLVNFCGTDTVQAVKLLKEHYKAEGLIGASVPASEHSVMCAYGREHEIEAFRMMLKKNPTGLVSIVSDTYDFFNVITNMVEELRPEIEGRDGKLVFRPDSGDPKKILCGDPTAPEGTPEYKGAIRILDEKFGSTVNSKGYKVLNPKVGLIYGDGMYYERAQDILQTMISMGYASTNLVMGIGGLLLQQHNRDDLGFAFKATFAVVNGEERILFKDPKTDSTKKSHRGRMVLTTDVATGKFSTVDEVTERIESFIGFLEPVFQDGVLLRQQTLADIRERSNANL